MPVPSKSWTDVADSSIDPDSPITTGLITALRDDLIHLREWLGAGYYAGVAQNHSHDGVDSALVEIGPNLIRNGSFESIEAGWTFTDFSGGSHSVSNAARQHGAFALTITSTVLANGGGEAVSTAYVPVAEGESYPVKAYSWASVANVSSRIEIVWYDAAKAAISATNLTNATNTPTSATLSRNAFIAPANARWARVRLTGGVPAAGSATGTVRFDGVVLGDVAAVDGTHILAAAVARAQLKTTTASGSVSVGTAATSYSLAGGEYSWWQASATIGGSNYVLGFAGGDAAAGVIGIAPSAATGGNIFYINERYVQASPPYDLGEGPVPLFVFALFEGATLAGIQVAPDPTWAYHGPTDITPDFWSSGRAYKRVRRLGAQLLAEALQDRALARQIFEGTVQPTNEVIEIDAAYKRRDMAVKPHPWIGNNMAGKTVALLDPVSARTAKLAEMHAQAGAAEIRRIIEQDYLRFDNAPLTRAGPPGVVCVAPKWRP